ncbi:glycosyltransferase [Clostridium intestinale]|uniref:Glycosyltransferase n=1 Tax=Clostridium intestinale TaxID=36845 RepID=A0A7D7A287_9CLOT|nr:glycosyltransferase [Clostridium intestinale]QLY79118.1 glycosyltransferase [Clostridium intestinale]
MVNKTVLFRMDGDKSWIAQVYYVKNILFSILNSDNAKDINIVILTTENNYDSIKSYEKYKNVKIVKYNRSKLNLFIEKVSKKLFKRPINIELLTQVNRYEVDYIYPITDYPYLGLKNKCIYWIPDFQHINLPQMFSEKEIKERNDLFSYMIKSNNKLVLSSNDTFKVLKENYNQVNAEIEVVPFISNISDELSEITEERFNKIKEKYKIEEKFIFVPNQFWKHKDHITVFKAIKYIKETYKENIKFIFTGSKSDYRNKDYFNTLVEYIKENDIEDSINILGFIDRIDQLTLMAYSQFIIQPSLYEGWSTVVEDAKSLKKKIILSNIEVHIDQKNDVCIYFEKSNYKDLALKIMDNIDKECEFCNKGNHFKNSKYDKNNLANLILR